MDTDQIKVSSFPVKHKIPTTGFLISAGSGKRKIIKEAIEFYGVPKQLRAGIKDGLSYTNEEGKVIDNDLLTTKPEPLRKYAFCADTSYLPDLKKILFGVNMIYHEASFMKEDQKRAKEHQHSTADQAAPLARDCEVGRLLIGHFSNKYINLSDVVNEAKAIFPENKDFRGNLITPFSSCFSKNTTNIHCV